MQTQLDHQQSAHAATPDFESPSPKGQALNETQRRLVEEHLHVVHRAAGSYRRRCRSSLQYEDLVQVGALALVEAARRFDAQRGSSFGAYALARVLGAIRDHFRALDPLSRSERRQLRLLESARAELGSERGLLPSRQELASRLGWDDERLRRTEDVEHSLAEGWAQTQALPEDGGVASLLSSGAEDTAESAVLHQELREQLLDALGTLPERKRLVLDLYYKEELRLHEIGEVLGVTESRACQLHREAVDALRRRLQRRLAVPA